MILSPLAGALIDDPSVMASAALPVALDQNGAFVRVDGVDLIGGLGLTPPFANAGGTLLVGATLVTLSGFSYAVGVSTPDQVSVTIAGLPLGVHTLEVGASAGPLTQSVASGFEVVPPFLLSLDTTSSGGLPAGPAAFAGGKKLFDASAGGAFAAPPVPLAGGGSARGGFVFSAEALTTP